MSDITMCRAPECSRSAECRRHRDSGTEPSERQAWSTFTDQRMWSPDNCWGFWPHRAERCGPAGVYGGRTLP